jgi:hypothetical protein
MGSSLPQKISRRNQMSPSIGITIASLNATRVSMHFKQLNRLPDKPHIALI